MLKDLLGIYKNCVVSIVGSGGKTSFMFNLAQELRSQNKVLLFTTTKIYVPSKEQYDFMAIGKKNFLHCCTLPEKGIYVYGNILDNNSKISGLDEDTLIKELHNFNYILIEADGSKGKSLKGWRENEPVIFKGTNITVGIIDITCLGKTINSDNIHRVDRFIELTNSHLGEKVSLNHLISLILHPNGLFKKSSGKKILFINKVEDTNSTVFSKILSKNIKPHNYVDRIIMGSLKNKIYEVL
ncbi:Putative selenium-dependent hydroxylase accessory protein YqeC [Clostridiaceae bacterium BL-3]|uniref:selenium cofactor biosynthesis protein YqeC n=1 Tax=Clostridium sp. MT-14 TaxID=3348360 RepID=UPI00156CB0E9|nr:Putative selenium-dependent hydroxylase accessory protein YqeC [Clostridiaceae bacterium BL-3]